jgi:glycosyltransferase involved in cell wall biosynthesis
MGEPRIKVLFNTPNPKLQGGPATHLPLLEQELHKFVRLETFQYGRKTDNETVFDKFIARSKDLVDLGAKINTFYPNIVHHNTAFDKIAVLRDVPLVWLVKKHRIPVLLKMHGSNSALFGQLSPPFAQLRNFILQNADCVGVLSEIEKAEYLKVWPFLGRRVRVVKNIIKPCFLSTERRESQRPSILFISRFIHEKGVFDLLQAIPKVLRKYPTAEFIFIGSGSALKEFDKRVIEQNLTSFVKHLDHIDNSETVKFYSSAWMLVFPSQLPEGMPMVVAEAMAAGLPIVTTRTNFSQSYMISEENCLFIEYHNPASIEKEIIKLLEYPRLRRKISENNQELAKSFRAEKVTAEFLAIYEEILRSHAE